MSVNLHGHSIDGDPTAIHYLENLNYEELETIIDGARSRGKSNFKYDDEHYEVTHNTSAGTYAVAKV
jgi:hypothetical protein